MKLPNVGDRVRHLKRGSTYRIIGIPFAALSEFEDGAEAFYWQWVNYELFEKISVDRPGIEDDDILKLRLPISIQKSSDKPNGNVLIYQCETDGKIYARYQSEFTPDRFETIAESEPKTKSVEDELRALGAWQDYEGRWCAYDQPDQWSNETPEGFLVRLRQWKGRHPE